MNGLWVTWEFQRRNLGISSALGWQHLEIDINAPRLKRYLMSIWQTCRTVLKEKPRVIAVQNPSLVLAVLGVILAKLLNKKLVMDAHNCGIYPLEGKSGFLQLIAAWLQRNADLVIVTNEALAQVVFNNGGRAFVLPDKISDPPGNIQDIELDTGYRVVFICTYSDDEPFVEVVEAARTLPKNTFVYFTGNYLGKLEPDEVPSNVKLLGFVDEKRFWEVLKAADAIMDLTTREDCLVCGAYEGISLSKPLILSNTNAITSYFSKGCVYVEPSAQSIARGITDSQSRLQTLQQDISELNSELEVSWSERINSLQKQVRSLASD